MLLLGKPTFDLASTFYARCVDLIVVTDFPFLGNLQYSLKGRGFCGLLLSLLSLLLHSLTLPRSICQGLDRLLCVHFEMGVDAMVNEDNMATWWRRVDHKARRAWWFFVVKLVVQFGPRQYGC